MILMISILVIGFLLAIITSLNHDKSLNDINIKFELSITGLKFEFKKKEKGSHPDKDWAFS